MTPSSKDRVRAARARILLGAVILAGIWLLLPASALAATADLSVDKSDGADPVTVGTELAYTVVVSNAGPDSANGVELEDELPNKLDFVAAEPSQGSCERKGKKVSCALGSLANAASATVAFESCHAATARSSTRLRSRAPKRTRSRPTDTDTETTTVVAARLHRPAGASRRRWSAPRATTPWSAPTSAT